MQIAVHVYKQFVICETNSNVLCLTLETNKLCVVDLEYFQKFYELC
jgi:hypothetical protein